MKITKRGRYQTREGRKVRIYAVGCGGSFSVHAALKYGPVWKAVVYRSNGKATYLLEDSPYDLIPAKKGRK